MLTTPGIAPPTLTQTRRSARPIVALARQPGPKTPAPQLSSSLARRGPFTTTSGAGALVVAETPCRSKASSHTASTAATTTGRYSGRQPAITALTAIFSTVARLGHITRKELVDEDSALDPRGGRLARAGGLQPARGRVDPEAAGGDRRRRGAAPGAGLRPVRGPDGGGQDRRRPSARRGLHRRAARDRRGSRRCGRPPPRHLPATRPGRPPAAAGPHRPR